MCLCVMVEATICAARFRGCYLVGPRLDRVVWPVILGYAETSRLLIGWCELRQAFRQFRTDRIQNLEILDQPIEMRRALLRQKWRNWRSEELKAFEVGAPSRSSASKLGS